MKTENPTPKRQFPRGLALVVAKEICAEIEPVTSRLIVAGSLRRGKASVGDVELLFVPIYGPDKAIDFFTPSKPIDLASKVITSLVLRGILAPRLNKLGNETWGPQNKLAVHVASGIPVDLFSTSEENWWVSLVIRTGSKNTNLLLTCGANKLGRTLNAYGSGVTLDTGAVIRAESEVAVFDLCGVPYLPPDRR